MTTHRLLHQVTQDGQDLFVCVFCGRQLLVESWAPLKRSVLWPGDEAATHVGGKGGLMPSRVSTSDLPARMSPRA